MGSDGLTKMRRLDDPRMVEARDALLAIGLTPYMVGGALAATIECATSDWWADALHPHQGYPETDLTDPCSVCHVPKERHA